jgi:hypothetical protein
VMEKNDKSSLGLFLPAGATGPRTAEIYAGHPYTLVHNELRKSITRPSNLRLVTGSKA